MILFLFAWLCSVDWDVAGPFDSDAPILIQVFLIVDGLGRFLLCRGGQMLGKTMKMIRHTQEENEQKVILAEQNEEHWEKWEVEMGVIESFVLI